MGAALSAMVNGSRCGRARATISSISILRYGGALQLSSAGCSVVSAGGPCASCKWCISGAAAAALRQLAAELLYVCAVEAQRCSLIRRNACAWRQDGDGIETTSGSSEVRMPAELILMATGRVRAGGALAALGDGWFPCSTSASRCSAPPSPRKP